jgi:orotate phosphoribosyltransferase-like protein
VAILDTAPPPVYQQIAPKALQLQQLGLSNSAIAKRLEVSDKTASKAISWLLGVSLHHRD